jgi:hypothetical protein
LQLIATGIAWTWIAAQTAILIGTIVFALWFWRYTIAEQAIRSRESFWATSNHYTPASIAQSAQSQAQDLLDGFGGD